MSSFVAKVFRVRDKDKMPSKSKTLMPLAIHNEGEPLKLVNGYNATRYTTNCTKSIDCLYKIEKQYKYTKTPKRQEKKAQASKPTILVTGFKTKTVP